MGRSRGGLTTKIHAITASDRFAINFSLSSGAANDSPEGVKLLKLGYKPVVPPKKNFKKQWEYDKELYKKRNKIERFFCRIKRFRHIFTRYDKLDLVFESFIVFAIVVDSLM